MRLDFLLSCVAIAPALAFPAAPDATYLTQKQEVLASHALQSSDPGILDVLPRALEVHDDQRQHTRLIRRGDGYEAYLRRKHREAMDRHRQRLAQEEAATERQFEEQQRKALRDSIDKIDQEWRDVQDKKPLQGLTEEEEMVYLGCIEDYMTPSGLTPGLHEACLKLVKRDVRSTRGIQRVTKETHRSRTELCIDLMTKTTATSAIKEICTKYGNGEISYIDDVYRELEKAEEAAKKPKKRGAVKQLNEFAADINRSVRDAARGMKQAVSRFTSSSNTRGLLPDFSSRMRFRPMKPLR